jgi:hypothetical protein
VGSEEVDGAGGGEAWEVESGSWVGRTGRRRSGHGQGRVGGVLLPVRHLSPLHSVETDLLTFIC